MRVAAIALLFCIIGYFGSWLSSVERLEFALRDTRAGHMNVPATGAFVLVAIDGESLDAIGTWPWSRQVHADLVDQLAQAGAADIFFDVDFAFAGDPAGDRAFTDALRRAGNVALPRFVQTERFGSDKTSVRKPFAPFADQTWPVAVNVTTDPFGLLRDYPVGLVAETGFVPSAAAFLSGRYAENSSYFGINFAIDPVTIPIYSFNDVLVGRFAQDAFEGRTVIVGATAIELGDFFNVPVHGVVPGAVIHALAAETLHQDSALRELRLEPVLIAVFLVLVALQYRGLDRPLRLMIALAGVFVATEAIVFGLQHVQIIVPTASVYGSLGLFSLWLLAERLGLREGIIARQDDKIREAKALLDQVFLDSFDGLLIFDQSGEVTHASQSAESIFGRRISHLDQLPIKIRLSVEAAISDRKPAKSALQHCVAPISGQERHLEFSITLSHIKTARNADTPESRIATVSIRDTTMLREKEREIAFLSTYDPLTGALRRNSFVDFIDLRIAADTRFALIAFNLRRLKSINLLLGRDVGDHVLNRVVSRLQTAGLSLSAPARLDGDTFAVFSEATLDSDEAKDLVGTIARLIEEPIPHDGGQVQVGASVGYALFDPVAPTLASEILSQAEAALDAARAAKLSAPQIFTPSWSERQTRARAIEQAMEPALERQEFFLTYQPQHRVEDGALIGSEALVRWMSRDLGPVFPDEFIEIAEANGFIVELGRWVLETALLETLRLPGDLSVAVNVSGAQMSGNDLVRDVSACLAATQFPAERLCLEMTESVLMEGSDAAVETMRDIQFLGPSWALDDFGTGYSSLAYLANFPLEKLKLDRSFTNGLGEQKTAETIVHAVKQLSAGLGMKLLCEGVETARHLEVLAACGCDEVQGYYFGKPMPFEDFHDYAVRTSSVLKVSG